MLILCPPRWHKTLCKLMGSQTNSTALNPPFFPKAKLMLTSDLANSDSLYLAYNHLLKMFCKRTAQCEVPSA